MTPVLCTGFGFHDDWTIYSYVPKRNKAVIRMCAMHHDKIITEKTEISQFYNETKYGLHIMDKYWDSIQHTEAQLHGRSY